MSADVSRHGPKWFEAAETLGTEAADNLAAIERAARHMAALVPRWAREQRPDDTRDDIPAIPTIQTPATGPVNLQTAQPEGDPVQLANDIRAVADRLEGIGEDVINKAEAIAKNPETAAVLDDLAALASVTGLPTGVISLTAGGLKALAQQVYVPIPAAPQQPADPQAPAA